jgi:hypothetical protein
MSVIMAEHFSTVFPQQCKRVLVRALLVLIPIKNSMWIWLRTLSTIFTIGATQICITLLLTVPLLQSNRGCRIWWTILHFETLDGCNSWENPSYIVNLGGSMNDGENSTDGRWTSIFIISESESLEDRIIDLEPLPTNVCKVLHECYCASVQHYYDHIF